MSKIFVGNLSFNLEEAVLETFIKEAGVEVQNVSIIRDAYSGRSRGFPGVGVPLRGAASILRKYKPAGAPLGSRDSHKAMSGAEKFPLLEIPRLGRDDSRNL